MICSRVSFPIVHNHTNELIFSQYGCNYVLKTVIKFLLSNDNPIVGRKCYTTQQI